MKLLYKIGVGSLVQLFKYGLYLMIILVNFILLFHFNDNALFLYLLFWMQSVVDAASGRFSRGNFFRGMMERALFFFIYFVLFLYLILTSVPFSTELSSVNETSKLVFTTT